MNRNINYIQTLIEKNMQNRTFINYKLYDHKKRRVAVFGQELGDIVRLKAYTCSKHDQFSKREARQAHNNGAVNGQPVHPVIVDIPILQGETAKFTFFKYCNENYYRKKRLEIKMEEDALFLYRDNNIKDIIFTGKLFHNYKMDK